MANFVHCIRCILHVFILRSRLSDLTRSEQIFSENQCLAKNPIQFTVLDTVSKLKFPVQFMFSVFMISII